MRKKTATKKTKAKKKSCLPRGYKAVRKKGKNFNTRYLRKMIGEKGVYLYEVQPRKDKKRKK